MSHICDDWLGGLHVNCTLFSVVSGRLEFVLARTALIPHAFALQKAKARALACCSTGFSLRKCFAQARARTSMLTVCWSSLAHFFSSPAGFREQRRAISERTRRAVWRSSCCEHGVHWACGSTPAFHLTPCLHYTIVFITLVQLGLSDKNSQPSRITCKLRLAMHKKNSLHCDNTIGNK